MAASKSSTAAALVLLLATVLLSAAAQAPAPTPEPDEDPRCPGRRVDKLIVAVLTGGEWTDMDLVRMFKDQNPEFVARCICTRIVGAAGIDVARARSGSGYEAINELVRHTTRTIIGQTVGRVPSLSSACYPEYGIPVPGLDD